MVDLAKRNPIGCDRAVLCLAQTGRCVFVLGLAVALFGANPILCGQLLGQETELDAQTQSAPADEELKSIVKTAFEETRDGYSSDEVILDDTLFAAFTTACQSAAPETEVAEFGWTLINLRKAGKLSDLPATQRRSTDVAERVACCRNCQPHYGRHARSFDRPHYGRSRVTQRV